MLNRFPLIGAVVAFAAFLLLGYGVDKHAPMIRAVAFALIALGVSMMGIHAILTREWRWGRFLSRTDRGFRAVWRGITLLIAATAALLAAWMQLHPGLISLRREWRCVRKRTITARRRAL